MYLIGMYLIGMYLIVENLKCVFCRESEVREVQDSIIVASYQPEEAIFVVYTWTHKLVGCIFSSRAE